MPLRLYYSPVLNILVLNARRVVPVFSVLVLCSTVVYLIVFHVIMLGLPLSYVADALNRDALNPPFPACTHTRCDREATSQRHTQTHTQTEEGERGEARHRT